MILRARACLRFGFQQCCLGGIQFRLADRVRGHERLEPIVFSQRAIVLSGPNFRLVLGVFDLFRTSAGFEPFEPGLRRR